MFSTCVMASLVLGQVIPTGSSKAEVMVHGTKLDIYTYKPQNFNGDSPMIIIFHGVLRNADEYRDHAKGMGDKFGALIVAPKFDKERFPSRKYNRGGLLKADGSPASKEDWTWSLIGPLANEIRGREGKPDMKFYLIGHSAGGQFVGRLSGFVDTGAAGSVCSNPSSYLLPTKDHDFGYGFGKLPEELASDQVMKAYLGRPLTIYLGTADIERDEDLDKSPEADRQGRNRLERGRLAFAFAERLAQEKGWPFRWRLIEAEGVSHDHEKMFNHPACETALFGKK
jgi:dienelactone hydrolase